MHFDLHSLLGGMDFNTLSDCYVIIVCNYRWLFSIHCWQN